MSTILKSVKNTQSETKILIFGDGASSGNPGPGGWGTILIHSDRRVQELGGREVLTTNNRMELLAVIRGLEYSRNDQAKVEVYTDSTYVIRGITQWVWGWKKRGWLTAEGKEVANQDLWRILDCLVKERKIDWKYVRGHSGIPANERVDEIAVSFSQGRFPSLYQGPLANYSVDWAAIPEDTSLPESKSKKDLSRSKEISYLSLVGNQPMRHDLWSECEGRVKGVSGAKFKKVTSQDEEAAILNSWGFKVEDLEVGEGPSRRGSGR